MRLPQHGLLALSPATAAGMAGSKSEPRHTTFFAAALPQAGAAAATVALPQPLRDATAVLESDSGSKVYVLGVSHVSKESCR